MRGCKTITNVVAAPAQSRTIRLRFPAFIADTGIAKIRQNYIEREEAKKAKLKQKDKMNPKMGRIDIDYQVPVPLSAQSSCTQLHSTATHSCTRAATPMDNK